MMIGQKPIVTALKNGPEHNMFYENVMFAFNGQAPPVNYGEYLKRSVEYASEYGMDAVHVFFGFDGILAPDELSNVEATPEELADYLAALSPEMGIGVSYKAPFSTAIDSWDMGVTDCLINLYEFVDIESNRKLRGMIDQYTEDTINTMKTLQGKADFVILAEPSGSNKHISPEHFREYVLPTYQTIIQETDMPLVVHLPGKIVKQIQHLKYSGINAIQAVDEDNLEEVLQEMDGSIQVFGNINEKLFVNGTKIQICEDFFRCVSAYNDPWVVHSSFWLPWNSDPENVALLSHLVAANKNCYD